MPSGQPSGDRIIWDDANEKHLLLCILAEANPQKLDWSKIAERFGRKLTSGAASQKYAKIKNRDKEIFEGSVGGDAGINCGTTSKPKEKAAPKRLSAGTFKHAGSVSRDYGTSVLEDLEDENKSVKRVKIKHEVISQIDD